jgi:3-phenylpropionate/cinnamic acid dioxygenase small subunit
MLTTDYRSAIQDLLAREAHLLDERRFQDWLELFTDDSEYVIPLIENVQGDVPPAGHPIVHDTKEMLLARIMKDETGLSHAEIPPSRTCHIVTNVVIEERPDGQALVKSAFVVRQARKLYDEAWWVGRRHDVMRRSNGGWQIAHRTVYLDTTVLPRGITIFF